MRKAVIAAALGAPLFLGACATVPRVAPGTELIGRSVQMQTAQGQTSMLTFRDQGQVTAAFGRQQVHGRWFVRNRQLCFVWTGAPQECWPYPAPFPRGRTVTLTSDRGNQVRVTLQ